MIATEAKVATLSRLEGLATGPTSRATRGLSLLIVDDEQDLTDEIAEAARRRGYLPYVANSATDAVHILEHHPDIGVMLTDIRMPQVDGLQLSTQVIGARGDLQALEVVIMTGHATLDDAIFALRAGAFDFVRKPFRFGDLFEVISRAMGLAVGRRMLSLEKAMPTQLFDTDVPPSRGVEQGRTRTEALMSALMHEARTPLVPVLGFSELLDSEQFSPDVRELARYIKSGGRQLQSLVGDFIMLAQIEAATLPVGMRAIGPAEILREAASALSATAQLARVAISYAELTSESVTADSATLERALGILISIAIQCTGREKSVTLSAAQVEETIAFRITSGSVFVTPTELASDPWHNVMQVSPLGIRLVIAIVGLLGGSLVLHKPLNASFDATLTLPGAD